MSSKAWVYELGIHMCHDKVWKIYSNIFTFYDSPLFNKISFSVVEQSNVRTKVSLLLYELYHDVCCTKKQFISVVRYFVEHAINVRRHPEVVPGHYRNSTIFVMFRVL